MNIFNKILFIKRFTEIMRETTSYNDQELKTIIDGIYKNYVVALESGYSPYVNDTDDSVKLINFIVARTGYSQDVIVTFLILLELWAKEGKIDYEYYMIPEKKEKKPFFELSNIIGKSSTNYIKILTISIGLFGLGYALNNFYKLKRRV